MAWFQWKNGWCRSRRRPTNPSNRSPLLNCALSFVNVSVAPENFPLCSNWQCRTANRCRFYCMPLCTVDILCRTTNFPANVHLSSDPIAVLPSHRARVCSSPRSRESDCRRSCCRSIQSVGCRWSCWLSIKLVDPVEPWSQRCTLFHLCPSCFLRCTCSCRRRCWAHPECEVFHFSIWFYVNWSPLVGRLAARWLPAVGSPPFGRVRLDFLSTDLLFVD